MLNLISDWLSTCQHAKALKGMVKIKFLRSLGPKSIPAETPLSELGFINALTKAL